MKNSCTAQQRKQRRERLELWTEWFLSRNKNKPISKDVEDVRLKASDFQCY